MKKYIVIASLLLIMVFATQQALAVSEAALLFLLISPGARPAGMGEAYVAVANDVSAVFWNPAGLAYQSGREITFMHANWLPGLTDDLFYEFLAYKMSIEERKKLNKHFKKFPIDEWVSGGYIRLIRMPYSLNSLVSRRAIEVKEQKLKLSKSIPKFLREQN